MILEFKYTFSEYFESVRNASWAMRLMSIFAPIILALSLVIGLALFVLSYLLNETIENRLPFSIYLIYFAIIGLWSLLPLLQAWLTWKGNPHVRGEIQCEINDDGVKMKTPTSDSFNKWESFIKTKETRNLFLLFLSKHLVYMVPKRTLQDEAQIQELRALIKQKITK